jgi:mannitol/fructose-specific phosphotransferase system IIA component (Ntr-type)
MKLQDVVVRTVILNDPTPTPEETIERMLYSLTPEYLPESVLPVLIADVLKRESLGTTGLGHGIAIPHVRSTLLERQLAVLAVSRFPVEYHAIDAQPVDLFILILAPLGDELQSFRPADWSGDLLNMLRDDAFVNHLRTAASPEELQQRFQERLPAAEATT